MKLLLRVTSSNEYCDGGCEYAAVDLTCELANVALRRIQVLKEIKKNDELVYETYYCYFFRDIAVTMFLSQLCRVSALRPSDSLCCAKSSRHSNDSYYETHSRVKGVCHEAHRRRPNYFVASAGRAACGTCWIICKVTQGARICRLLDSPEGYDCHRF